MMTQFFRTFLKNLKIAIVDYMIVVQSFKSTFVEGQMKISIVTGSKPKSQCDKNNS